MKTHLVVFLFCSLECKWARLNPGALVSPAAERERWEGSISLKKLKIHHFCWIKSWTPLKRKKSVCIPRVTVRSRESCQSKRKEEVMWGKRWWDEAKDAIFPWSEWEGDTDASEHKVPGDCVGQKRHFPTSHTLFTHTQWKEVFYSFNWVHI